MVCQLAEYYNAYDHIKVKGEKSAEHDNVVKVKYTTNKIEFDQIFSKVEKVIVFDDILTKRICIYYFRQIK